MLTAVSATAWRFKILIAIFCVSVSVLWAVALSPTSSSGAQDRASTSVKTTPSEKIHITADRMVVDNLARTAEFSGRVRAVQGTFVITSQSLKIFYRPAGRSEAVMFGSSASIEKIVANGDVKILFDDKIATAAMAEYQTDTQVLILSGADSRITSAKNSITGAEIIFYRTDERVIVKGEAGKRVEAEFYPEEQGTQ